MSSEPTASGRSSGHETEQGPEAADRLEVLGNDCSRTILVATRGGPRTAKELTDRTDCSSATVYRRINDLLDSGFLEECVRFEEGGSHTTAYRATVSEIRVCIGPDGIRTDVSTPNA